MTQSRIERIRETLLHAERGAFTGGNRSLKRRPTVRRPGGIGRSTIAQPTTRVAEIADVINALDPDDYALLVERLEARKERMQ